MKMDARKYLLSSMNKLEADLCMPLFSEDNLIGFLALKKKESDLPYSNEEIKEFLKMKRDLEISLMNILIKMNLEEENNLMKVIIDKKTRDLREKMRQIKELLKQQSDFIAVTAHEFRTPLSIALFQLEEMSRTTSGETSPTKLRKDLQVIDESLDNLKVLTQKLFAVQQYDLNKVKLNREKTDIKKFMKELYKDFLGLMKEKKLDFILEDNLKSSVFMNIDKSQIRQVMHNILTNAYKFCSEKGRVKLALDKHGQYISICISDDGKGIPDNLKKSIFNKFRTNSTGAGIGLGLYICKKIIELHKSKIWVDDSEWGGAKICIQLNK
jgi:signal transduction histidine kinase